MANKIAKYTLRVDYEVLKKFRYVAEANARSTNRELEVLMKSHIEEYEKKNGPITFEQ